jgi:hypothetical protein
MRHAFNIFCISGGHGWGSTGQKGYYISRSEDKGEAQREVSNTIPGGWKYDYLGPTNRSHGLEPSLGNLDKKDI